MRATSHRLLQTDQYWIDRLASWFSDRCSPILVKEARQAMKSWHFQWTFLALLSAVVAWSFLGISLTLYNDQEESGGTLLAGYMLFLGFPLWIVLPLASFRSLAREFDDETIQLLSITTLNARQIVLGKLGSATLQLIVYLSAVVPCVAFSYLLRGIDLTHIVILLLVAIVGSLSLCCLALMLAGFARFSWLGIVLNLGLMAFTGFAYYWWCGFNADFQLITAMDGRLWTLGFLLALLAGTGYVAFECATSLISFPSEDRSSRIKVAISMQVFLCVTAYLAGLLALNNGSNFISTSVAFQLSNLLSHYFCLIGAMLVSEQSGMSQRVRRGLPRTFLGRVVWGVYVQGPGRGYLYALSGILCWNLAIYLVLSSGLATILGPSAPIYSWPFDYDVYLPVVLNSAFATCYLSFVYTYMLLFGRRIPHGRALVGALLVAVAYAGMAVACTVFDSILIFDLGRRDIAGGLGQHWNWPYVLSRLRSSPRDYVSTAMFASIIAAVWASIAVWFALREWAAEPAIIPLRVQEESKQREFAQVGAP